MKAVYISALVCWVAALSFAYDSHAEEITDKAIPACSAGQMSHEGPVLPQAELVNEECIVIQHGNCEKTDTCDLVEIGFWVKEFKRMVKKTYATETEKGSMFYAWYQTKTLATLEKYVFVQYVRGCAYNVMYWEDEARAYFWQKEHHGVRNAAFCYPNWEIDMYGNDPVYTSGLEEGFSRHHYAQWTKRPREFPTKYAKEYGAEKPTYPVLGMVDLPDTANVRTWPNGRKLALNTALQFRTCLYRADDVPLTIESKGVITAEPLKCFNWQSMHVYDPVTDKMTSPDTLPEICTKYQEPLIPFTIRP